MMCSTIPQRPIYDRENRFFDQDLAELGNSAIFSCSSASHGGPGLSCSRSPDFSGSVGSPGTALAINMHL